MKLYSNSDTSVIRHHYEKKLLEMEQEKKVLQVINRSVIWCQGSQHF